MKTTLLAATLLLTGCVPVLHFQTTESRQEMLDKATLVFVGVIEQQEFERYPFFIGHTPNFGEGSWKVLRRVVRVETVIRGTEPRKSLSVYEIFWTGGTTGDWNGTRDGDRAVFLVQRESGVYRLVQDWWRSIFPVTNGPHGALPLDDTHPLWERIALSNWRFDSSSAIRVPYPQFRYNDPGGAMGLWRTVKIKRGLVRHPSASIQVAACRDLLLVDWGQDECWDLLSPEDRSHLRDGGYLCCTVEEVTASRRKLNDADPSTYWRQYLDVRRLLTTINNKRLRDEICVLYRREYPGDTDNGCALDQPPPATIVTERGDVPLVGPWPRP